MKYSFALIQILQVGSAMFVLRLPVSNQQGKNTSGSLLRFSLQLTRFNLKL